MVEREGSEAPHPVVLFVRSLSSRVNTLLRLETETGREIDGGNTKHT